MSYAKAVAFASDHLKSVGSPDFGQSGHWQHGLSESYNIRIHGGIDIGNRKNSDIWFEISELDAKRLVNDSQTSAEAWDFARSICINNLLRERPIGRPLIEFACAVMLDRWRRPRANERYSKARRNVILSAIIFEVWVIFDLSEAQACRAVKDAAHIAGFAAPAELQDIWRNSDIKLRGLPARDEILKRHIMSYATERLEDFRLLNVRETAS